MNDKIERLKTLIHRYDQQGPPEHVDFFPVQLGLVELMQRALPYAVPKGKDPDRPYLEGVCVRQEANGPVAWVSSGPRAVRFLVMDDVSLGFYSPDSGMVLREHDYPDIRKALPVVEKDRYPVHAFALRALAEMAIESCTAKAIPLLKLVMADDRKSLIGQPCLKVGNRYPEPVGPWVRQLVASDPDIYSTGAASLYDAAFVLEAVKGQRGALFTSIPRSAFDPLVIERADGILHVLAPQDFPRDKRSK